MLKILPESVVLSVIPLLIFLSAGIKSATGAGQELPGTAVPVIPAIRVDRNQKHPLYNSNPPTSGWYTEGVLRDGLHTEALKDEQIVEAIYNGKVVIVYNCQYKKTYPTPYPDTEPEQQASDSADMAENNNGEENPGGKEKQTPQEMQAIYNAVISQNIKCGETISFIRKILDEKGQENILVAPKPSLDARIAAVSWGRMEKQNFPDRDRLIAFIDVFRGKVPN